MVVRQGSCLSYFDLKGIDEVKNNVFFHLIFDVFWQFYVTLTDYKLYNHNFLLFFTDYKLYGRSPSPRIELCHILTKYERLSEMCIVPHVETKNVFTFQPIKRLVSTTVKSAKLAATF